MNLPPAAADDPSAASVDDIPMSGLSLPDQDEAKAETGYERGAITPFGARRPWPVIVDATVDALPVVAIGGGARGVNVHLAPADLLAVTGGDLLDISNPDPSPPHDHGADHHHG